MADIQNDRDLLLQADPVRFIPPPLPQEIQDAVNATKGLSIVTTGDQFKVSNGIPSPASIIFTINFRLISGVVSWSVVQGTATLGVSGNTATLLSINMSTDRVRVRAAITVDGVLYSDEVDVTRVSDGSPGQSGSDGDSVDAVFRRLPIQPSTPSPSVGTPSGWYSDVNQVPPDSSPMWSSMGTRQGGATNYIWQTPLKIEGSDGGAGLSIAEVTVYRRLASVPPTPTGGSFNFGTQTLTPPANWSWSIPTGTNPVYISKAVVSVQGTTGVVAVTGWSAPVLSMSNGAAGNPGSDGSRGTVQISAARTPATWSDAAANTAITNWTGSSTRVPGDQVALYNQAGGWAETRVWTGSIWQFVQQLIDGNLIVTGSFTADKITGGIFTGLAFRTAASGRRIEIDSANNAIVFYNATGGLAVSPRLESSIQTGQGIRILSPSGGGTTSIQKEGGGTALDVTSQNGFGISITSNGFGASQGIGLRINANGFPDIWLTPTPVLPSQRFEGAVCYYNGYLCFANGSHWYRCEATQLT